MVAVALTEDGQQQQQITITTDDNNDGQQRQRTMDDGDNKHTAITIVKRRGRGRDVIIVVKP